MHGEGVFGGYGSSGSRRDLEDGGSADGYSVRRTGGCNGWSWCRRGRIGIDGWCGLPDGSERLCGGRRGSALHRKNRTRETQLDKRDYWATVSRHSLRAIFSDSYPTSSHSHPPERQTTVPGSHHTSHSSLILSSPSMPVRCTLRALLHISSSTPTFAAASRRTRGRPSCSVQIKERNPEPICGCCSSQLASKSSVRSRTRCSRRSRMVRCGP